MNLNRYVFSYYRLGRVGLLAIWTDETPLMVHLLGPPIIYRLKKIENISGVYGHY